MTTSDPSLSALHYGYDGQRQYSRFYKHSGKVTFTGAALAVIAGVVCGSIFSSIYAYSVLYIPYVKLNFLLCIGVGAGLGAIPALIMRWGKVRNVPVSLAIVGVITLVAYYVCWVVWLCAVLDKYGKGQRRFTMLDLLINPAAVARLASVINGNGTWSMSQGDPNAVKGIWLGLIWLIEAGTIFGMALLVAKLIASDIPFCEKCNRWCAKDKPLARIGTAKKAELAALMEAHDFAGLARFGPGSSERHTALTVHSCPGCNELHTVTATEIQINPKRKRNQPTKTPLVKKLLVSAEEVEQIRTLSAPTPPPELATLAAAAS